MQQHMEVLQEIDDEKGNDGNVGETFRLYSKETPRKSCNGVQQRYLITLA